MPFLGKYDFPAFCKFCNKTASAEQIQELCAQLL